MSSVFSVPAQATQTVPFAVVAKADFDAANPPTTVPAQLRPALLSVKRDQRLWVYFANSLGYAFLKPDDDKSSAGGKKTFL